MKCILTLVAFDWLYINMRLFIVSKRTDIPPPLGVSVYMSADGYTRERLSTSGRDAESWTRLKLDQNVEPSKLATIVLLVHGNNSPIEVSRGILPSHKTRSKRIMRTY